jgi:hypothetical protein
MSWNNTKIEGGSGGKRGHSNMDHRDYTEIIKEGCRKKRRAESKNIARIELEKNNLVDAGEKNSNNR